MTRIKRRMPPTLAKAARRAGSANTNGRLRVATGTLGYGPRDAFKGKRPPTAAELVSSYRGAVYCCAQINAGAVAAQPIRLYVTTSAGRGQKAPRCRTRPLDRRKERHLWDNPALHKRLETVDRVDEVIDHPLLDLLDYVNPFFNKTQLWEVTQLYLEITGEYYWYKHGSAKMPPSEVWPLPAWLCRPIVDYVGTNVIDGYLFAGGGGNAILDPDAVLYGRELSLFDPYTMGWSWLRANYDQAQVYDKNIDYRESVLSNRGRPDAMLIPKEEDGALTMDPNAIQRIQFEYEQSFGLSRAGRLWVPPGGMELKPLSWSPQDMGELALSKSILHDIARAASIPIPIIDGESANRANMDAALLMHARLAVKPRCRKLTEHLNSNFVNLWDERLFLEFDNPVPADQVLERETHIAYVGAGVITRNEVRTTLDMPPVEGGDELLVSNSLVPLAQATMPPAPAPVVNGGTPPTGAEEGDADEGEPEEREDKPFEEGDDVTSQTEAKAFKRGCQGCHEKSIADERWYLHPDGLSAFEADLAEFIKAYHPDREQIEAFRKAYKPCRDARGRFARCGGPPGGKPAGGKPSGGKPAQGGGGSGGGGASASGGESAKPAEKPAAKPAAKPAEKPGSAPGRDMAGKPAPEVKKEFESMSKDWKKGLSEDEAFDLRTYTGQSFGPINTQLRDGNANSPIVKSIDKAIGRASLKEDTYVYRGVKDLKSLGLSESNLTGAVIHDKAYMSTSVNRKVAETYADKGAVIRIKAPAGSKGASVAGITRYPKEQEVVFARNSKLKITGHERDASGRLVIHAELHQ